MPTGTVVFRDLVNQLYFSCQLRLRQIFGDFGKASRLAILNPMGDDRQCQMAFVVNFAVEAVLAVVFGALLAGALLGALFTKLDLIGLRLF